MQTLGPFYNIENNHWIFILIDKHTIQMYDLNEQSLHSIEDSLSFWMFDPCTNQTCHVNLHDHDMRKINITESSLGSMHIFLNQFNFQSKSFENVEISQQDKRKFLKEYAIIPIIDQENLCQQATTILPPLSLLYLNQLIGNYPLTESNRNALLSKLQTNWPFASDLTQHSYVEIAGRVLGGNRLSEICLEDLGCYDDPSELLRDQWIVPAPFTNPEFDFIEFDNQKIYARHFVGLLFAQVLKVLNASSDIPYEFRQPIPKVLSENHAIRENFLADTLYAISLQEELYNEQPYSPPKKFESLDTTTKNHFYYLINNLHRNVKNNFKQCIYHDIGQIKIWQWIINFLRKIAYYLNFGRFYDLSIALSELDKPQIELLYQGLFQTQKNVDVDAYQSITDYMLRA